MYVQKITVVWNVENVTKATFESIDLECLQEIILWKYLHILQGHKNIKKCLLLLICEQLSDQKIKIKIKT